MEKNIFTDSVNWNTAFDSVDEQGYAFSIQALEPEFLAELQHEAASLTYERAEFESDKVRLEYGFYALDDPADFSTLPVANRLLAELNNIAQAQASRFGGLTEYRINRLGYQQYRPGEVGVTPHLDPSYNKALVFVISVSGEGEFGVTNDRAATDIREKITTTAGDVIVLRGPGFNGSEDGRVLHYARPLPHSERISLGLRMEIKAEQ